MEETNSGAAMPAKRPTFITVLCILSFVGIGFSLIGGIMNYFTYSALASGGGMLGGMGGGEMGAAMNNMADALGMDYGKMATSALVTAVLNLPLLLGVLMMWKQKKTGFYIYAATELIQAICPLIIVGGLAGGVSAIAMIIFGIAFIVMYGVNLKHMS
ncbi:MAG: hypothetical protein ACJ77K_06020 [Bacteroidia bacterium]